MSPFLRACAWVLSVQALEAAAAQAKTLKNSLEKPMMLHTSATALLQEIEEMARSGEAPAFDKVGDIKAIVNDNLKPDLERVHQASVDVVAANLLAITACNSDSTTRSTEIHTSTEVSVGEARSGHETCREEEKVKHADRGGKCGELDTFLDTVNEPSNLPSERPRAGMVEYVQTMSNYFCPKGPEVTTLNTACTLAEGERAKHKAECDTKQATFEAGFCTWRTELVDNCDALTKCHARALQTYTDHKAQAETLVTKWKLEFAALDKIVCYLDVWLSDTDVTTADAGAYATCNSATPVTTSMDIDFGTPDGEETCPLSSVVNHPGTTGFVTAEYSDINDFVEAAIPCIGLPATPAPGSLAETSAQVVEADGTVHSMAHHGAAAGDYHRSQLDGMELPELMRLVKSLGANTKDVKAALASSILKLQRNL